MLLSVSVVTKCVVVQSDDVCDPPAAFQATMKSEFPPLVLAVATIWMAVASCFRKTSDRTGRAPIRAKD